MPSFSKGYARAISALFTVAVACGCSPSVAMRTMAAPHSPALGDSECFSRAYAAADRSYKKHFKSDWSITMRAIVKDGKVSVITLSVGPYDGSFGGGILAKYECTESRLLTLEYER